MSGVPTHPQTSVPFPTLTPQGFVAPQESDILAGVQTDTKAAFGDQLNFTTQNGSAVNSTPQSVLTSSWTAIIGDSQAQFLWYCNQVDPAFSTGRMQDAIGRIYFIERIAGAPTVVEALCTGLANVVIPVGALAKAPDGNLYVCTEGGIIPSSGSITLPFACTINGPIPAPASSQWSIYQAIPGWDTIATLADGALGNNVESPSEFEFRRSLSTGWNAMGPLGSILGAVYQVPNVIDAYVRENDADIAVTIGGVILGAHSLYVCVLGGEASAIANAIWTRKMPGCGYNGNTSYTVTDPNPKYNPPKPMYAVTWETPTDISFVALAVINNNPGVPSNALTLVQNAVISAFAGTDGGSRARIGSTILASRYYEGILTLGSWAQLIDLQIGVLLPSGSAFFTGSITGATMTATGVAAGTLAANQLVLDTAGLVSSGTLILAQTGGTPGGDGTYTVSIAQAIASGPMTATTLVNSVTMNIDQAPVIAPSGIALQLVG
jgi:hypothetical protein